MSYVKFLPTNRAVLFANLGQALNNGEKFPQLFATSADISPPCYAQALLALATAVQEKPDQPLLQHIVKSSLFLPWEIRFIRFGLATLRIAEVFARLCDYYVLVGGVSKRLIWWFIGLWSLLSVSLGYGLFGVTGLFMPGLGLSGSDIIATAVLLVVGWLIAPLMLKGWIAPDSPVWVAVAKLPYFRSLVVSRSVYQYLLNLGLCIQGNIDLERSLNVCAKSEPVIWLRQRYQGVAEDVAGGARISKAFVVSGILKETRIVVTRNGDSKPGALWESGITDVVRQSFSQQLQQVAQILPFLLMIPIALVWLTLLFIKW